MKLTPADIEAIRYALITDRKDSFSLFTEGLRSNWIFVLALFSLGWWLVDGTNEQKNINAFQDAQVQASVKAIEENKLSIAQLNVALQTSNTSNLNSYNELIRKIDSLQAAIDALKNAER